MGRELQKKKNRSSLAKVRHKPKSKRVNPLGNPIIAANWNQKETLTQNYRRLGLASRLNAATGGIEKLRPGDSATSTTKRLAITNVIPKEIAPKEARIERDANGKIIRVVHEDSAEKRRERNPLNDQLNDIEDKEEFQGFDDDDGQEEGEGGEKNEIVQQLEELASRVPEKKPRKQSTREQEWIERLVGKYGDDYRRMARDMKLNPMQQTEGDIKRRVEKWRGERE
ncbi:putative nucleolar protein 16 [Xylogone sp. PMI_703]|nr:putative nucleolar protein 16 [Xylogone sp. PMI_703]